MSVLDQWRDRWEFAAYNHEQQFQTKLVTKRRLFNAIVNYPLTQMQNDLLRPDLIKRDPVTGKKIRKVEFDAAAWRFVDDVLIGAGGGQFVRSFAFAYGNNKDFRDVHGAARALEGFGISAEVFDDAPRSLSAEIKDGRSHAVYDLVNHSAEASELLDQFVHGKLDISPSNVAKLQRHLTAMATLCEEKAELRSAYEAIQDPEARAAAEARGEKQAGASGYIRDVIRLERITTPRQAQILSGFVAALLVDAAKPLGTEMYIPQSDIFMPPEDAVKLSTFIDGQMESRGFVPNVSLGHGERPLPELPEGAMIKQVRNPQSGEIQGYQVLSQAETMAFANAVHSYIGQELGSKIENMLRYVDKHFDEIEDSISRSQENPIPAPMPVWEKGQQPQPKGLRAVEGKIRSVWEKSRILSPVDMMKDVGQVAVTAVKHVTRPEARHENNKLFGRAIAGQVVGMPVRIFDEALKTFLRPGKGLDKLIDASKTGVLEGNLFERSDFTNNMKSNLFRLITGPLAASIGTVGTQELFHLPKGLAIEAANRAQPVLKGAIMAGNRHAPQVAQRMKAMEGPHPAIQALMQRDEYKTRLPEISAKKPDERSEEDYRLLANYYAELSEICVSVAEEALSPYGVEVQPEKISSMDEVVTRVLRKPVENVPDAMVALAYVQSFIDINAKHNASVEYVDPTKLLVEHGDLRKLAGFAEDQAKAAGLVVAKGNEFEGVTAGELLERDGKGGQWRPASEDTLVRYANVLTGELKKHVDIDNLLYAVKGKHQDVYLNKIESALFGDLHFQTGAAASDMQKQKNDKPQSAGLTEKWQSKVKRKQDGVVSNIKENLEHPEVQHEVRKLLGRGRGESVSAFIPGLVMNSLQHNENIFSRSGVYSAVFKTLVYPPLYSKGLVAAKEAINESVLHRRHIINESNVAQSLVKGAIATAGNLDTGLRDKLVESNQVHADILALQKKDEYKDIPRIAAKPRTLRTEDDNLLMQRFCADVGHRIVDNSTRIFSALGSKGQGESIDEVMERALEKPVDNLGDAVIALGFVHSMVNANAKNLDSLSFIRPEDKVLDRKKLRAMSEFMNDQAANAGFALHGVQVKGKKGNSFTLMGNDDSLQEGELLQWNEQSQTYERASAESVIRYANVVMEQFRTLAQDRVKENAGELVDKYKIKAKDRIFKQLKSGDKAQPEEKGDVSVSGNVRQPAPSHQKRVLTAPAGEREQAPSR